MTRERGERTGVKKAASGERGACLSGCRRNENTGTTGAIRVRKGSGFTANTIFLPYKLTEDSGCAGTPARQNYLTVSVSRDTLKGCNESC